MHMHESGFINNSAFASGLFCTDSPDFLQLNKMAAVTPKSVEKGVHTLPGQRDTGRFQDRFSLLRVHVQGRT